MSPKKKIKVHGHTIVAAVALIVMSLAAIVLDLLAKESRAIPYTFSFLCFTLACWLIYCDIHIYQASLGQDELIVVKYKGSLFGMYMPEECLQQFEELAEYIQQKTIAAKIPPEQQVDFFYRELAAVCQMKGVAPPVPVSNIKEID